MARVKVKVNRAAVRALMRNAALVEGRGEAIAAACNSESSWGGYSAYTSVSAIRARSRIVCADATPDRANRLVRNLDAGS